MNKTLKITLLSDMLPGSGIGYGAAIDADACFDTWGFPYIPGKRIKGVLRRAAREALDLGVTSFNDGTIDRLFGTMDQPGQLSIQSAYLEDYESLCQFAHNNPHPAETISQAYSYLRSQTAIDGYGKAKQESLRTTRVLRKGLVFLADIELSEAALYDILVTIVQNFYSMGAMRNRGLGAIRAELIGCKPKSSLSCNAAGTAVQSSMGKPPTNGNLQAEACLSFCFRLLSPVLATNNFDEDSALSIPGSTIRGCLVAVWMRNAKIPGHFLGSNDPHYKRFAELFLSGQVSFKSATITDGAGNAYHPLAASVMEFKTPTADTTADKKSCIDTAVETTDELVKSIRGTFVRKTSGSSADYVSRPIATDVSYHMSTQDTGTLFQYSAIQAGQRFRCDILGPWELLKELNDLLKNNPSLRIGRSRTAQYGAAHVETVHLSLQEKEDVSDDNGVFLAVLETPAWILSDTGVPLCDAPAFEDALKRALPANLMITRQAAYLRFCRQGGYNPVWRLAKPTAQCLDAGSALKIQVTGGSSARLPAGLRIGENAAEGLGYVRIIPYTKHKSRVTILPEVDTYTGLPATENSAVVQELAVRLQHQAISAALVRDAMDAPILGSLNPTTVHALILALRQADTEEKFFNGIKSIKDDDKKKDIFKILFCGDIKNIRKCADVINCKLKNVCHWSPECGLSEWALLRDWQLARLTQYKQIIRRKDNESAKRGDTNADRRK